MTGGSSRQHDRELLDALETHPSEAYYGETWRITVKAETLSGDRPPVVVGVRQENSRSSTPALRQRAPSPRSGIVSRSNRCGQAASNTKFIGSRPGLATHFVSLALRSLSRLGVDIRRHVSFDYSVTQAIAAAAFFLDFDGLIVPSAASAEFNLVIFLEMIDASERLKVEASQPVDWKAWRSQHRNPPPS